MFPRLFAKAERAKNQRKDFVYSTRLLRWAMLVWGLLPLYEDDKNTIRFKFKSWRMLYSVLIYTTSVYVSTRYAFYNRILELILYTDDFDRSINNIMFLSFAKTQYLFPICGWFAAGAVAHYYNLWKDFSEKYSKKFKEELDMTELKYVINKTLICVLVMSFSTVFGQLYTLPTYKLEESLGYLPSSNFFFGYIILVYIHCSGAKKVSEGLQRKLKAFLSSQVLTKDTIITFKYLWADLSNITQHIGTAFSNFNSVMLFGSYLDILVSSYGYFSFLYIRLRDSKSNVLISPEEFGLLFAFFATSYILIHINNTAYFATKKVEEEFIDILCMATTKPYHPEVIKEIDTFLLMIKHNPPVLKVTGSTEMNRRFISSTFSTICTYLVVLIQFKIGLHHMRSYRNSALNYKHV